MLGYILAISSQDLIKSPSPNFIMLALWTQVTFKSKRMNYLVRKPHQLYHFMSKLLLSQPNVDFFQRNRLQKDFFCSEFTNLCKMNHQSQYSMRIAPVHDVKPSVQLEVWFNFNSCPIKNNFTSSNFFA